MSSINDDAVACLRCQKKRYCAAKVSRKCALHYYFNICINTDCRDNPKQVELVRKMNRLGIYEIMVTKREKTVLSETDLYKLVEERFAETASQMSR